MSLEQLQEYWPFNVKNNFAMSINVFDFYCLLVFLFPY